MRAGIYTGPGAITFLSRKGTLVYNFNTVKLFPIFRCTRISNYMQFDFLDCLFDQILNVEYFKLYYYHSIEVQLEDKEAK